MTAAGDLTRTNAIGLTLIANMTIGVHFVQDGIMAFIIAGGD